MIDLADPLQWNLIVRSNLVAGFSGRIAPQIFVTPHHEVVIGIKVVGQPTWRWGGYLTEQVDALPSSTAILFDSLVQVGSYRLTCRQYQAIDLSPALPLPLVCRVDFPIYFQDCSFEVFARNDI